MESVKPVVSTSANSSLDEIRIALHSAKIRARRAEREVARLERKLKEAQEAEKVERIKAFLEANKGRRVVIEWEVDYNLFSDKADNIYFYADNKNDKYMCLSGKGHSIPLCLIERIYVEAEIWYEWRRKRRLFVGLCR